MCPTSLRYQLFLVRPLTHRANCKIMAVLPTAYLVADQSEAFHSFGSMNKLLLFKIHADEANGSIQCNKTHLPPLSVETPAN